MGVNRFGSLDPSEVADVAIRLGDDLVKALGRANERLELERRLLEHPWLVLGLAGGAGFVLGGGLWPLLRPVAKSAARAALVPGNLVAIATAVGAALALRGEEDRDDDEADERAVPH
ncbi:MAG TPA: hypothetical protein VMK12_08135 [Anaeromyxobacteraceae bacterium]|nr:hypothetical protein [Anaeromyxobacteraceae bacterium]